jgi:hypothetical protein
MSKFRHPTTALGDSVAWLWALVFVWQIRGRIQREIKWESSNIYRYIQHKALKIMLVDFCKTRKSAICLTLRMYAI